MATQKQVVKSGEKVKTEVAMPRQKVVRDRLLEVSKDIETGYVDMAQLLSEAYHRDYHEAWGFDSFTAYAEAELEIDYRKARYLIDIWDKIKSQDLPKAQVAKLGWTKMKEIAAVITKENAKVLLADAAKMSSRELIESVKIMRRTGSRGNLPEAPVTQKITFTLGESEHHIVMEALDSAKKLCNSDNLALALEMVCQDWLADKGSKPEATHLEDHIKYLEKVFPVKLSFKIVEKPKKEKEAQKVLKKVDEKVKSKNKRKTLPDPEDLGQGSNAGADIDVLLGGV